jgi:hypothetical protein
MGGGGGKGRGSNSNRDKIERSVSIEEPPERLERSGPLLTVKTEANGASKSTNKSEPFLVCCWACAAEQEIFVLPWLLLSAQYKLLFSSLFTISIPLSPIASKLARQPCWVACLLACVSRSHKSHK